MSRLNQSELDELTAWAESDAPVESGDTVTGDRAAEMGRRVLRLAGRPTLGSERAMGRGRSPRRQVRLPDDLNHELDRYASDERTSASEVIRVALSEYLARHHRQPADA